MKIAGINMIVIKPRSVFLFLAGFLFLLLGLAVINDRDFSSLLLHGGSLLKGKAAAADWADKLKTLGWESVKFGAILFLWALFFQFIKLPGFKTPPADPEDLTGFKREYLYFIFSLCSAILLFIIIAFIITKFYHPDIGAILKKASEVSILDPGIFQPKPLERLIFGTGLILLPVFAFVFYIFFKTVFSKQSSKNTGRIFSIAFPASFPAFLGLALAGLLHSDPDHNLLNVQFYFLKSLPYLQFSIYSLIIFPAIFFFLMKYPADGKINRGLKIVFSAVYAYIFLLIPAINIFNIDFNFINLMTKFDAERMFNSLWSFSAVYYSVTQAAAGVPLLVSGFTNTYGLYPQFLVPLFNLTGLSILSFSIVMSVLLCLSFGFLLIFLHKIIDNRTIVFLCFTSIVFLGYLFGKIMTWDFYFQYHPLRFIFPMLLLMISALYFEYRKKRLYYLSFILSSISVLWNPDTGTVVFLSWLFYLCYLELENLDFKKTAIRIILHFINAALILFISLALYSLSIRLFYGSFPDLMKMFSTISLFSGLGFGMLPMPLLHPWNIVVLTYLIGFLYAFAAFINNRIDKNAAIIFLVSLVGTGTFVYYGGRSHNWNLVNVWSYFFILIAIFADLLLSEIKRSRHISAAFFAGTIIFILSFSFIDIFSNSGGIYDLIFKRNCVFEFSKIPSGGGDFLKDNIAFIKKYAARGEKIIVLSRSFEGMYLNDSRTISAFNPGFIELFTRDDAGRLSSILETSRPKVFLDDLSPVDDNYFSFIKTLLDKNYKIADRTGTMFYYKKLE